MLPDTDRPFSDHATGDTSAGGTSGQPLGRVARTWHALSPKAAIDALESREAGLTAAEVAQRRAQFGENALPEEKPRSLWKRFLFQLNNLLIYVLLGSAAITMLLGHPVDTLVILSVVVINAIFGVVQEGKAERALDAIRAMISPTASVIRDRQRVTIPARDLVPGDMLLIEAGDRVTADARLVSARGLRIDEAALTGESVPVDKRPQADLPDSVLAERASMAYSGTLVTQGQGMGVVVATGARTEIGRITNLLSTIDERTTPLIRQMNGFARQLSMAILALCAVTFIFAIKVRDYTFDDAFLAVVGMAVAAIPEGLPAVMTITLAIGVERMSRRHAIVRKLPAVETLGSVSVICTDKTGTLTRNEMTARHVVTSSCYYEAAGSGYAPRGTISGANGAIAIGDGQDRAFDALMQIAALCNDARLIAPAEDNQNTSDWHLAGDPMEGALLALAEKAGCRCEQLRIDMMRLDVIPFDAAHRFMATLNGTSDADNNAESVLLLKGAPEDVLAMCSRELGTSDTPPLNSDYWQQAIDRLAEGGEDTRLR